MNIIEAAQTGNVDMLRQAIQSNIDVNTKYQDEITPLMAAAANGKTDCARELLAAGADVHSMDRWGMTALHIAACNGRAEVVEVLLQCNARVNDRNHDGETALHWAGSSKECVALLLKANADPSIMDCRSNLPEECSTNKSIVQQLRSARERHEGINHTGRERVNVRGVRMSL